MDFLVSKENETILLGVNYKINDDLSLLIEGSYNPDIPVLLRDSAFKDFMKMKNNTFDIGFGIKF